MNFDIVEFLKEHTVKTQLFLFLFCFFSLWFLELYREGGSLRQKLRFFRDNLWVAAGALSVQTLLAGSLVYAATLTTQYHIGLLYLLPYHESLWVSIGVLFVLRDLLDYFYHRMMHSVPFFWRFHMVHHSDPNVDVTTTVREHFAETAIRNLFLIVTTLLLGVGVWFLILRQIFQTVSNISSHSAVLLPPRLGVFLGWFLVTPNFHRMHHHFRMPHTNRNYGDSFTIWDRIFGSLSRLPPEQLVAGLDTTIRHRYNGWNLLKMPFRVRPSPVAGYIALPPSEGSR